MNDIRIYDYEFNLLHIEPDVLSAYWILNYNDIGTFEGTFPLSSGIADVVMKNKYLILVQGEHQALVTAYLADKVLTVYGKTPNWILSRRTYPAFKTSEMTDLSDLKIGTIVTHIVSDAFADVENFTCADLTNVETEEHFWRNTRNAVSDIVKEGLNEHSLGHRVRLDIPNKKWIFEVYAGEELPLIVSEANRNLTKVSVSDDAQSFFDAGWYCRELEDKGEWDASGTLPGKGPENYGTYYTIKNDEETGSKKYPNGSYLVCTDKDFGVWRVCSELPELEEKISGSLSGIYSWDTSLSGATEAEAKTELSKKLWSHEVKGEAYHLKYGKEYHLGDMFRVQVQKGTFAETALKTVSGVEIWWESGNIGEKLKFKEDNNVL